VIPIDDIQALADRISTEFPAERIILFGSYAWGSPTSDSDFVYAASHPVHHSPLIVHLTSLCGTAP
jgi:hypothetical protein